MYQNRKHRKFVNQCALYKGQFITKLIKTWSLDRRLQ